MESESILPEALNYMKQLRNDVLYDPYDTTNKNGDCGALIVSLYCIDSSTDIIECQKTTTTNNNLQRRKLHQKLAMLHSILHTNLLPQYRKKYSHCWHCGGEGITFGLHCSSSFYGSNNKKEEVVAADDDFIPHLRAIINYGPNPCDSYYALALIFQITLDLFNLHKIEVAASCWDVEDGQILLIQGADTLPTWVDDEVGVEGMSKRVFIVRGEIRLLPPTFQSSCKHLKRIRSLSIHEALLGLLKNCTIDDPKNGENVELNQSIERQLHPFRQVIQEVDVKNTRIILKNYIHTAAVVLPLHLALLIRQRPDLIPCAILTFCKLSPSEILKKKSNKDSYEQIPFENLVVTTITISKTLYAMLLTSAGQIQPPIKIPKHYRSIELNRMKRQVSSGDVFGHLRHALEIGIRLALGFEWSLRNNNPIEEKHHESKTSQIVGLEPEDGNFEKNHNMSIVEKRITLYHTRIDQEAGGGGEWIRSAWAAGPNLTCRESDISALIKCPVWYPEIQKGGICPIQYPGKGIPTQIRETLQKIKREEAGSKGNRISFPIPRANDVDSDSWIDLESIDILESKMKDVVHKERTTTFPSKDSLLYDRFINDDKVVRRDENINNKTNIQSLSNEETNAIFEKRKYGDEGVKIGNKKERSHGDTSMNRSQVKVVHQKDINDEIQINPRDFIHTLYNVMKANDGQASMKQDDELLQYFSREDLETLNEESSSSDGDKNRNCTTKASDFVSNMSSLMDAMEMVSEEVLDTNH